MELRLLSSMPLYRDHIFPRAYDLLMGLGGLDSRRADHLATVRGHVLEVGIGTGLNLRHYPAGVTKLTGLDHSAQMLEQLARKADRLGMSVGAVHGSAEHMPLEDSAFDFVVTTHALCSLQDRSAALREIRRVLKPGGGYVFLEHGLSPDAKVAKWQGRLNGIQQRFAVGCTLDVDMEAEIQAAGFKFLQLDKGYQARESKTHGYLYEGIATPL